MYKQTNSTNHAAVLSYRTCPNALISVIICFVETLVHAHIPCTCILICIAYVQCRFPSVIKYT